jgi:hypothetical protein
VGQIDFGYPMRVCCFAQCGKRSAAIPVVKITGEGCQCVTTLHVKAPLCADHAETHDPFNRNAWDQILLMAVSRGVHIAKPITLAEVSYEYMM